MMIIRGLIFVFAALWITACQQSASSANREPVQANILFIFADDQTFESIRALGNEEIYTPNLDRLVRGGVSFTNAYNMGAWNGAVCAASRAMLVSGRSVWRANAFRQHWVKGDSLASSWPQLMAQGGYRTYMSGKWHVDAPAPKIFHQTSHIRPGMPPDNWNHAEMVNTFAKIQAEGGSLNEMAKVMPIGYNRPLGPNDNSWSPTDSSFGGFWSGGTHWSEVLRDDALHFIQDASKQEAPFFMYLAFNAAHDPRQAPQTYQDMYSLDSISLPQSWLPMYPYQLLIGNGPRLRDEALAPFPRTKYATKVHTKEYYALITHMDEQIGNILDALEASGKAENTYVFFTADHGLAMGRHGLLGKQSLFEHSMKVPFVITGPGIPAGKQVTTPIYLQDIMPSCLDIAGIKKPAFVEFQSVMDLARGKSTAVPYEEIYGGYINFQRMIRKGDKKLIVYPQAEKVLLFDLAKDPEEMKDLAENPVFQEEAQSLFQDLMALQKQMDDTLDLSGLYQGYMNKKADD